MCRKFGIECAKNWSEHVPASVYVNEVGDVEKWWDRTVLTGRAVNHTRLDVIVIDRGKKTWTLVDFSVPLDKNIVSKENEILRNTVSLLVRFGGSTECPRK